jgi:AcrR family transcriptional regulator
MSFSTADPPRQLERSHPGRPLDARRDSDLRQAALELVAEIGYDRMTIDAVATRAKAGKATVYRRWASKAELVIDAFVREALGTDDLPDTGSLRGDLLALSRRLWEAPGPSNRARVMAGLVSALLSHPELRQAMDSVSGPPHTLVLEIFGRAASRGEIPVASDLALIGSILPSVCMFHLVTTGEPPTAALLENVIDHVVLPAIRAGASAQPDTPSRRRARRD